MDRVIGEIFSNKKILILSALGLLVLILIFGSTILLGKSMSSQTNKAAKQTLEVSSGSLVTKNGAGSNVSAEETASAQSLAGAKIAQLAGMPYSALATEHGSISPPGNIPDSERVTSGNRTYVVHITITYAGGSSGSSGGKEITVQVKDDKDQETLATDTTTVDSSSSGGGGNSGGSSGNDWGGGPRIIP